MGFPATFSRAASDPQWQKAGESLCLQGKNSAGLCGFCGVGRNSHLCTEDPIISAYFDPKETQTVVCLASDYSRSITAKSYKTGLISLGDK